MDRALRLFVAALSVSALTACGSSVDRSLELSEEPFGGVVPVDGGAAEAGPAVCRADEALDEFYVAFNKETDPDERMGMFLAAAGTFERIAQNARAEHRPALDDVADAFVAVSREWARSGEEPGGSAYDAALSRLHPATLEAVNQGSAECDGPAGGPAVAFGDLETVSLPDGTNERVAADDFDCSGELDGLTEELGSVEEAVVYGTGQGSVDDDVSWTCNVAFEFSDGTETEIAVTFRANPSEAPGLGFQNPATVEADGFGPVTTADMRFVGFPADEAAAMLLDPDEAVMLSVQGSEGSVPGGKTALAEILAAVVRLL